MNTGDVYYWETAKAKGHETRRKYHIYICDADWADDVTFMFICSISYTGDFAITKDECPFLKNDESYISCSAPVLYTETEIKSLSVKMQKVGSLPKSTLRRLLNHILDSETLERQYIKRISEAIAAALRA